MLDTERTLEKLCNLYITFRQRYVMAKEGGSFFIPKKKSGEFCRLTNNVLRNHQGRQYAVAVFAGEWGSKFLCFDVDDGSKETVRTIIEKLAALGIPSEKVYVSFSGNKGYHVETFFDAIVETQALRNLYEHVIRDGQLDPKKVEFKPTQHCAIKLPLSIHAKTGNFCCFVDPNSFAPIEDETYFWGIRQNHVADVQTALSLPEIKEPVRVKPKKAKRKCASKKDDRKQDTELIEKGTRHDTMVRIAVFHRLQGSSQEECKKVLLAWYAAQDQTMTHSSEAEVMRDIEEIINWLFSDHFHPALKIRQKNSTTLSATQILKILDSGNRSERRIYFLLLLRYRMGQMRITANDIRKVVGVSRTTVNTAIKKLLRDHVIAQVPGKRKLMPDGHFTCEGNGYVVLHEYADPNEPQAKITMKDLTFDFDRVYFTAMQSQVPEHKLQAKLTVAEWKEYQSWMQMQESGKKTEQEKKLINAYGIAIPRVHALYGSITGFEVQGRRLYPAVEAARLFGYSFPNVAGSQCGRKELWNVEMTVSRADREKTFTTIVEKNFIPEEDVRRMAQRSKHPDADVILAWILGEERESDADEE